MLKGDSPLLINQGFIYPGFFGHGGWVLGISDFWWGPSPASKLIPGLKTFAKPQFFSDPGKKELEPCFGLGPFFGAWAIFLGLGPFFWGLGHFFGAWAIFLGLGPFEWGLGHFFGAWAI